MKHDGPFTFVYAYLFTTKEAAGTNDNLASTFFSPLLSILLHYWHLSPHAYNAVNKIWLSFCLVNLNTTAKFRTKRLFHFRLPEKNSDGVSGVGWDWRCGGGGGSGSQGGFGREKLSAVTMRQWRRQQAFVGAAAPYKMWAPPLGAAFWRDCNIFHPIMCGWRDSYGSSIVICFPTSAIHSLDVFFCSGCVSMLLFSQMNWIRYPTLNRTSSIKYSNITLAALAENSLKQWFISTVYHKFCNDDIRQWYLH